MRINWTINIKSPYLRNGGKQFYQIKRKKNPTQDDDSTVLQRKVLQDLRKFNCSHARKVTYLAKIPFVLYSMNRFVIGVSCCTSSFIIIKCSYEKYNIFALYAQSWLQKRGRLCGEITLSNSPNILQRLHSEKFYAFMSFFFNSCMQS